MIRQQFYIAAVVFFTASAAYAHSGSLEDQIACTPDVYRLCASQIPDEGAIVACLVRNKAALSSACGRVFAHPNVGAAGQNPDQNDDD